jgi:class 3 adenylate cyclase
VDDAFIEDLKEELLFSHPVVDEDGRGLVWIGETEKILVTPNQPDQPEPQPVVEQTQPVQATASPATTHAPDAERPQLTVMFVDMVESTALSGELDPEDYREVVRQYQQVCSEVIQRYDGYVAQLLGDGLLVYFGYPVAHEDDAQRAVRAGLGIIAAIQTLNMRPEQARGIQLAIRLGIHTGLVVVGEMGGEGHQEQLALVGREREVDLLLDRWEQAKEGQGQVVLLSGEAGIGKSRLVQVLKDHVAEGPHTRLECRSLPYFTYSALYPIINMLQRVLWWRQDAPSEEKLERLEQNLSPYRLPLQETVPLFASLLSLPVPENRYPPLNLTPQRQRQKTLEAIVAITLELSERQPVLFILEDTHWQDPSTHELLDLLIDQTPTASLLILITYRPEFQPMWGNRSYLTQITLNRLSRDGIEQMASQVAGGKTLPEAVLQQLVEKTDGVPLFVEEMTKSVLESGHLKEVDGEYELSGLISTLTIPATLQDSLMSRLD